MCEEQEEEPGYNPGINVAHRQGGGYPCGVHVGDPRREKVVDVHR